jgi:hypothetical protein
MFLKKETSHRFFASIGVHLNEYGVIWGVIMENWKKALRSSNFKVVNYFDILKYIFFFGRFLFLPFKYVKQKENSLAYNFDL